MSVWGLCLKREDSSTDIQDAAAKVYSFVISDQVSLFCCWKFFRRHLQALGIACESDDVSLVERDNRIIVQS